MTDAPKRIWLQDDGDYEGARNSMAGTDTGVTWCDTQINDNDSEYIRADLVPGWSSDMDAAPKDGAFVLVFSPDAVDPAWNDPGIRVSNWEAGQWQGFPWTAKGPYAVTHWMPLPAPPKEGE